MISFATALILSPVNLNGIDAGRKILKALSESPHLAPHRFNNYEPIRLHFDPADLNGAVKHWRWPFLWKRSKPSVSGSVWGAHTKHPRHSAIKLATTDYRKIPHSELIDWMLRLTNVTSADLGIIHLFTDDERQRGVATEMLSGLDRAGTRYTFMTGPDTLQKNLPDCYWAMAFGPPYLEMFGREHLLAAPAHVTRELPSGHVYIQLTEHLLDIETDHPRVAAVRDRVIDHLGRDAFFAPERTYYRVPEFTFYEPGSE